MYPHRKGSHAISCKIFTLGSLIYLCSQGTNVEAIANDSTQVRVHTGAYNGQHADLQTTVIDLIKVWVPLGGCAHTSTP